MIAIATITNLIEILMGKIVTFNYRCAQAANAEFSSSYNPFDNKLRKVSSPASEYRTLTMEINRQVFSFADR